jgi:hypothetical protein
MVRYAVAIYTQKTCSLLQASMSIPPPFVCPGVSLSGDTLNAKMSISSNIIPLYIIGNAGRKIKSGPCASSFRTLPEHRPDRAAQGSGRLRSGAG